MMDTVLIVEDEAVLRLTFRQFLESVGIEAVTVDSYDAAIAALGERSFGVVVSDVILGGKTGVDLLRWLHRNCPDTEVIMITGEPNVETAAEAVRLGAYDYLSKPVSGRELNRVVKLALEQRSLKQERDAFAARTEEYRRELETIFQSVNEAIITFDVNGAVCRSNAAFRVLFGDLVGPVDRQACEETLKDGLAEVCEAVRHTIATGEAHPEFRVAHAPEGKAKRILLANTAPLVGDGGVQHGAVLVIRDVTRLTLLEEQLADSGGFHGMIGRSQRVRDIFELIKDVAATDSTVLISGESGTGKELVAAALHEASPRKKGPFVRVNCAALPEDILESELFGHVKGSFTGAVKDRVGRFQAAHGGTIFLDEIADVSQRLQQRLLRVLQEREFERVGDTKSVKVDIRIIAATNKDLPALIAQGRFREDLYYRLNVVRIEMPPLRERREDIPVLADFFCRRYNAKLGKEILGFDAAAIERLTAHHWPGNIRELENCVERAFVVCHDPLIQVRHLPRELQDGNGAALQLGIPAGIRAADNGDLSREHVLAVLQQTDWNIAKSARILGVARNTVYHRIRHYNLSRPESP